MHRLESELENVREMVRDNISRCRIELLLLMAKHYRQGAPLGPPSQSIHSKGKGPEQIGTRQAGKKNDDTVGISEREGSSAYQIRNGIMRSCASSSRAASP